MLWQGQLMMRQGLAKEAMAIFERALDIQPDHTGAMMVLATLAERVRDNTTEADELFHRAFLLRPNSPAALSNYAYWLETRW